MSSPAPCPELRQTGDGSYTLYDEASGECFHSHKGALTESEHVFIEAGQLREKLELAKDQQQTLNILEMGLGTGLNYLLTARLATQIGTSIDYHALELNPLDRKALTALDYQELPELRALCEEYFALMDRLHERPPGSHRFDTSTGSLTVHLGDATQIELPEQQFSLCYFDAFSPSNAPALWRPEQLKKFYCALVTGGTWVSYCARGAVRRDLVGCGFRVERLAGPPGKREMLRATR